MINLYQGDCINILDTLITNNVKINTVITDIPYFRIVEDSWDNLWESEDDYLFWIRECIKKVDKLLLDDSSILLFTGRQSNHKICNILDEFFIEKRIIIWSRKRGFNNTRGSALASGYEPICYYTKGNPTFNNIKIKVNTARDEYINGFLKDGVSLSDVWSDIPALPHNAKEKVDHPTQKPVELMKRCIEMVTNKNDTVLDFTMGSGTTGVACKELDRNFIGIELNEEYFRLAKERIDSTKSIIELW